MKSLPGFIAVLAFLWGAREADASPRLNVLMLVIDDLRPDLGCYGNPAMHSPNLDRLASRGLVFERAYAQVALCNPSRASVLTGLRPDSTGVFDNGAHFRENAPDAVTLPQALKEHGYRARNAISSLLPPACCKER